VGGTSLIGGPDYFRHFNKLSENWDFGAAAMLGY